MKKKISLFIHKNVFEGGLLNSKGTQRAHKFFSNIIAILFVPRLFMDLSNEEYFKEGLNCFFETGYARHDALRDVLEKCKRISAEIRLDLRDDKLPHESKYEGMCLEMNFYGIECEELLRIRVLFDPISGKCNYFR